MYNNMMSHFGWILRINTGALEHKVDLIWKQHIVYTYVLSNSMVELEFWG